MAWLVLLLPLVPAVILELAVAALLRGTDPPECVTAPLSQPAGTAWVKMCGSTADGESPFQGWAGAGNLTVDGFTVLIPPADCPRVAPCVILAETGPPS